MELANNFTLPTANLNLDVQLEEGVRLHLRTYLSSRHHPEAWVKGGYVQIDELNFIREGFLSGFMNVATIRFGMDEINYGDMHFRRSDNARSIYNPFVANYIMDAFTTEPFAELTLQQSGWLGVAGISNGRLNQSPVEGDGGLALYGKLGYDKQLSPDFRLRLTGSVYHSTEGGTRDYLYGGDRAGSRYYKVLEVAGEERPSDFFPRFNPGFNYLTALQFNPFVKYQGLEFFGILERTVNGNDAAGGDFNQYGAELIYRFGSSEQLYVAGRYNWVEGQATDTNTGIEINRSAAAAGWFITPNMLLKAEYVSSFYNGTDFLNRQNQPDMRFWDADYSGFVAEAVISF